MHLFVEEEQSLDVDMRCGKDSPPEEASLGDTTCAWRPIRTQEALSSKADLRDVFPFVRVVSARWWINRPAKERETMMTTAK